MSTLIKYISIKSVEKNYALTHKSAKLHNFKPVLSFPACRRGQFVQRFPLRISFWQQQWCLLQHIVVIIYLLKGTKMQNLAEHNCQNNFCAGFHTCSWSIEQFTQFIPTMHSLIQLKFMSPCWISVLYSLYGSILSCFCISLSCGYNKHYLTLHLTWVLGNYLLAAFLKSCN